MKKDPEVLLFDILDSIENIRKYTKNVSEEKFFNDVQIQDAVVRRIEIIGEAVKGLSDSFKNKHPNVLWREIAGTRDVLIHDYSGIDIELVWEIVKNDIIKLEKQIKDILK